MKQFNVILSTACTLVIVSQLHFTLCSDIRAPTTATTTWSSSIPISTRPTSRHSTGVLQQVRFPTMQAKVYATTLDNLLRTILVTPEFRDGPSTLHRLLAVLRPFVRAIVVASSPSLLPQSSPPPQYDHDNDTITTISTASVTPSTPKIACPPAAKESSKKLMSLFVPMSAVLSSTSSPPLTGTLPKLFRKVNL